MPTCFIFTYSSPTGVINCSCYSDVVTKLIHGVSYMPVRRNFRHKYRRCFLVKKKVFLSNAYRCCNNFEALWWAVFILFIIINHSSNAFKFRFHVLLVFLPLHELFHIKMNNMARIMKNRYCNGNVIKYFVGT